MEILGEISTVLTVSTLTSIPTVQRTCPMKWGGTTTRTTSSATRTGCWWSTTRTTITSTRSTSQSTTSNARRAWSGPIFSPLSDSPAGLHWYNNMNIKSVHYAIHCCFSWHKPDGITKPVICQPDFIGDVFTVTFCFLYRHAIEIHFYRQNIAILSALKSSSFMSAVMQVSLAHWPMSLFNHSYWCWYNWWLTWL